MMLLKFKPNVLATLGSATTANIGTDARICGSKGMIEVPSFYGASSATLWNANQEVEEQYQCPHKVNGYEYEAMAAMEEIRRGETQSSRHSLEDTLKIMKIMDDLRRGWKITYPGE